MCRPRVYSTDSLNFHKNPIFLSFTTLVLLKETYANHIFVKTLWPEEFSGIIFNAMEALYKKLTVVILHGFSSVFLAVMHSYNANNNSNNVILWAMCSRK